MIRVIFNQKGGVGKSSITCNLAAISAEYGLNTLIIDLDPQANASQYCLGKNPEELSDTITDFFLQNLSFQLRPKEIDQFVHKTAFDKLHVIPANAELEDIGSKLEARYKIYKLKEALEQLHQYDAIFIDTPPAMNFFTRSALIAADRCIIPFDCDAFSQRALFTLLENAQEIQIDHNPRLEIEGIIVNQFQPRAKLPKALIEELEKQNLPIIRPFLSSSIKMKESHQLSQPLIYMAPTHKLTAEFIQIHQVLIGKEIPQTVETLS